MKNILIVDDDISIGNMLEEMLRKERYAVFRAYSGTEALLLLRENKPDLVLLDLMLPGMSGEEVLPHFRGIPVIVMSARADVDDKVELLLGGAADYVTKPFSGKELLARIAVQLREKEEKVKSELNYDKILLNTETGQCFVAEKEVHLTRTEYAILKMLLANPSCWNASERTRRIAWKTRSRCISVICAPSCDRRPAGIISRRCGASAFVCARRI